MWEGLWESEMTKTPPPVDDVQIELFIQRNGERRIRYTVRVYREDRTRRIRLLDVMYPNGVPVHFLPRGAKKELKRVFPLAVLML
jgi:hypothetical protein